MSRSETRLFVLCIVGGLSACSASGTAHQRPEGASPDGAPNLVDAADEPGSFDCSPRLLPGRCGEVLELGHDVALETLATKYDRNFHSFAAAGFGLGAMTIELDPLDRALIADFIRNSDSWDFEDYAGQAVTDVVDVWNKSAGLYAGVALAADAYRYGVMRDQGYPTQDVARAREHLLVGLEALHLAVAITGREGAIARGTLRTDIPTIVHETTPLFDGDGSPLPAEKNNGTWREDASAGLYASYQWEDSCSRDMLLGWVSGFAGAWEVIRDDSSFSTEVKQRLQADASSLVGGLMTVRESGYDLELIDGDGRITFHGYLHEENVDGAYVPGFENGAYATMALGIVAALTYVTEDAEQLSWLGEHIITERKLHLIARDELSVDAGPKTNYSGYNMAFQGAWLALRYVDDSGARAAMQEALARKLYDNPKGAGPQPVSWGYSLFDFIYAASMAGATAYGGAPGVVDAEALARGLGSLGKYPEPPYWNEAVTNCDETEIELGVCTLNDGTVVVLNPVRDWHDEPQALDPIPFELRPPSNYQWRSSPLRVNGTGSGATNYPSSDFRYAYWLARWVEL